MSIDLESVKNSLKIAAMTDAPKQRVQRDAFKSLMPVLFLFRSNGYSFEEITIKLVDVGFKLSVSTVRGYYYELFDFISEK